MGLNILPKSGINFRSRSGAGNFMAKFNKLTRYEGGEFGMLKNNRKAIAAAISKRAGTIKLKGGLDRMQRKGAFLEIMKNDKSLTKEDKYKVKELLNYYARGKKDVTGVKKASIDIQRDDPEKAITRPTFAHVSNPNFFREPSPIQRGADAGNRLRYEKMQRLGSSEAARKLQKDAFSKLQGGLGHGVLPENMDRGGVDLLKSLN